MPLCRYVNIKRASSLGKEVKRAKVDLAEAEELLEKMRKLNWLRLRSAPLLSELRAHTGLRRGWAYCPARFTRACRSWGSRIAIRRTKCSA
jgi:hypothetical protein